MNRTKQKTGPKKPYAIDNILKIISEDKLREIKIRYYVINTSKYTLAKDIGLSHQLMSLFLNKIGKPTRDDIIHPKSLDIIMENINKRY